jgi:hypothetical protein
MGRASKNPNHPITRLRKILSGDGSEVTREIFSERTGIPLGSVKAIETGVYKLSPELAKKVAFATGVDSMSLFIGEDPLRDIFGNPYTYASYEQFQLLNELGPIARMMDAHALCLRLLAIMRAVKGKDYTPLFVQLYQEFEDLRKQYKLEKATSTEFEETAFRLVYTDRLEKNYPALDPSNPLLNFNRYFEKYSGEETAPKKPRAKAVRARSRRVVGQSFVRAAREA